MGARAAILALVLLAGAEPAYAAPLDRGGAPPGAAIVAVVPGRTVIAHARPGGPAVGRIRDRTPFGSPTRLAVLARRGEWLQVHHRRRLWIKRSAALRLTSTSYAIVIDRSARTLELRDGRRTVLRTKVAVGRAANPTPIGRFGLTDKLAGHRYGAAYGCCILALSAVQRQLPAGWSGGDRIALHGTNAPSSIGQATSSGCVRVAERPLRTLVRRLPLGTPVIVRR